MLFSEVKKNLEVETTQQQPSKMSPKELELQGIIKSNSRFNELVAFLSTLPNWEEISTIIPVDSPYEILQHLYNRELLLAGRQISREKVLKTITHHDYVPTIGKFYEYKVRDKDNENDWVINDELSEFSSADFHVDHRLIIVKEIRSLPSKGASAFTENINIYVYVPFN